MNSEKFKTGFLWNKPKIKKSGTKWMVFAFHTKYFYLENSWQDAIDRVKSIYNLRIALR